MRKNEVGDHLLSCTFGYLAEYGHVGVFSLYLGPSIRRIELSALLLGLNFTFIK